MSLTIIARLAVDLATMTHLARRGGTRQSCERSAVNNEARAKAYKTPVECAGKRGAMSAVALMSLAWIGEKRHNNGGLHSLHSTGLIWHTCTRPWSPTR